MSSGRISLEEVLAACDRVGTVCEPVTANEVGEELGCTRRAALNKLDELAERGDIESKKVGARSRVWWRPPDRSSIREQADTDDALESGSITIEESLANIKKRLEVELDKMFGRISDAFYALDDQWRFTYVNDRAEELIDYQGEGLVGKNFWEVFEWADGSTLGEEYREAMATQEPTSFEFYYPEPLDAWYEVHAYPSETGLSVYFQDITERKERERELERALDLLDRTERIADVGGWEIDVDTQDVFWTDHIFELLEVDADEEPPLDEALDMYHEEDKPIVVDAVENALASGEPFDVEVRVQTEGGALRWLRLQGIPETDDGDVVSFRGAAQDVTEKVERERDLEERNDRLESFASMLAHELRNPVTIGQIYSQQLPDKTDSEAVEYVTEAFDRIEAMIDVMLILTRGHEAVGEQTPIRLADIAQEAWEDVDAPDATVAVDIDYTIQGDETYIRHLFQNLFENAVEHGGRDVTVTVGELPTGFYVADDGPGIPVGDRDAVFEPGFTTAAEQGGIGLGLAFVEKLAEVYEWESAVTESTAGGAQFEFTDVARESPPN